MWGAFEAVWARYVQSELEAAFFRLSTLGWKIFDKPFSAPTPTVELDPETTLVAIIDPQRGFSAPSGTFGRVFGAEELEPLREALKELALFLNSLPEEVGVVLVVSEYPKGLHTAGTTVEPLSNLCVAGDRDCDLADGLAIKDSWVVAIKHWTDARRSLEFRSARIVKIFEIVDHGISASLEPNRSRGLHQDLTHAKRMLNTFVFF